MLSKLDLFREIELHKKHVAIRQMSDFDDRSWIMYCKARAKRKKDEKIQLLHAPMCSFCGQSQRRRGAIGSFRLPRIPKTTKKTIRRWCSLYMLRLANPACLSSFVPYMRSLLCCLPVGKTISPSSCQRNARIGNKDSGRGLSINVSYFAAYCQKKTK